MSHIPGVTKEENTLFGRGATLLCGWEEGIGHFADTVLSESVVEGSMHSRGKLREDFVDDESLRVKFSAKERTSMDRERIP